MSGAPHLGTLEGGTHARRVVALAGALAEAGVAQIDLSIPGRPPRVLRARESDLPGVLQEPRHGVVLLTARGGTRIEVTRDAIRWRTADRLIAERLRDARAA